MKILTIPLLIFSIYAYAGLSQVQQINFIPSTDTQGARAESKADSAISISNNALTKANSVEGIAQDAHSMANSFKKVATTPNSCLNNANFTCTDTTFDSGHQFQTKTYGPGTHRLIIPNGITKIYTSIQGPAGYVNSTYDHCSNRYNPSTCVPSRSYIKVGNQTYYSPTGKTGDANTTSSYGLLYRYSGENYDTLYYAGYDNYTPNNYSLDVTPGQQITVYVRGGQSWQYNGEYGRTGKAWKGHDGKVVIQY
jgi:hypothetical protein